jgi:predicted nuclease of predicted toxin-antitoxin system
VASFYIDHDVNVRVAQHLHALGHAARTARDLQLERAQDDQQLLVAAQNGWTLVTHNRKDFILLHRA